MNFGWIATVGSPSRPHVLLSLLTEDITAPVVPDVSIGISRRVGFMRRAVAE